MALSVSERLGPYEILGPLGAGGMGEVYRARDAKLDREVAIKVLPAALAHDSERLARFEREAKVLAALNHPNIAQIYGFEESGATRALVMELVPGQPVKGPLPLETALTYAQQIADALEAAHEKGITHRDLKPANIMVTPDGVVKVLDFGLASVPSREGSASDPSNSPTMTMAATQAGMIMGTAAYMSPEQAAGKTVDKRADIWSFGVVLWEMLTGKRLFDGETISHTLAAVLTKEPDLQQVPLRVRRLLKLCLEKDPKKRLQAISDWRLLISDESRPATPPKTSLVPWAVAGILAIALAVLALVHFREKPPEMRVVSSTILPPEGVQFEFGSPYALPALSPDGTRIVFGAKETNENGKPELWVRRLDSPSAQHLHGTENAGFPFWSPDSRWIGFAQNRKLKKIDIEGGPPLTITDFQGLFRGGSWNRDGVILFSTIQDGLHGLFRVAAAGGTPAPATTVEQGKEIRNHVFPWFLPDGHHFLHTGQQSADIPVRVGSLDQPGKPGKVVAQANSNAVYSQGYLLYLRENTLMAQPFDLNRLETRGDAVPLVEGVPTFTQPSRGAGFSMSAGGLLVYISGAALARSKILWEDRQGKTLGDLGESPGQIGTIALSRDGKRLAADIADRSSNSDIWIYDVARGIPTRFTFDPTTESLPVWSPDGSTIYFHSSRGAGDIFRKPSNGSSPEELLLGDSASKYPLSVSPDGKLLLYERLGEKTGWDLWVLPLAEAQSGRKPEPSVFLQTQFNEILGQFSPDGHWVAYQSNESGPSEVCVVPFPGPGGKHQISSGGGQIPRWSRDGKELFYVNMERELMAAEVTIGNGTFEVGRVQKLFGGRVSTYDVFPDGQKFAVVEETAPLASAPLTLLQNWPAALRK